MRARALGFLLAWVVLFAGCREKPATQLLVVLDSDLPIGSALQTVLIVVTDASGREVVSQQEFAVFRSQRPAGVTLPVSFGVVPLGGDAARRIRVIARANVFNAIGGRDVLELTAITGFIDEKQLVLPMFLQRACVNVVECGDGLTCVDGECVSAVRAPESLQTLPPGAGLDASGLFDVRRAPTPEVGAVDAAAPEVGADAGFDVSAPDVLDVPTAETEVSVDASVASDAAEVAEIEATVDAPIDTEAGDDAADVPDVMDAADVPDVMDVADVPDVMDVADVPAVMDVTDVPAVPDVTDVAADVPTLDTVVDPCSVPGACAPFAAPRLIEPLSGTWAASGHVRFRVLLPAIPTGVSATVRLEVCAGARCVGAMPSGVILRCAGQNCSGVLDVPPMTATGVMSWRVWLESPPRAPSVSGHWLFHPRRNERVARDGVTDGSRESTWGTSVDLTGDGLSEMVVGAPRSDTGGVFVANGTRSPMLAMTTPTVIVAPPSAMRGGMRMGYDWGHTIASAGDMNGDGADDLAVASLESATVAVYPGGGGFPRTMFEVSVLAPPSDLGRHLAAVGDINQDGYADLAMSFPSTGRVRVVRGSADGPAGFTDLVPPMEMTEPEMSLAAVGDLNGDQRGDVVAGYPGMARAVVWISDFLSGTAYRAVPLTQTPGSGFGRMVAGGSDVNGDGLADVAVASNTALFVYFGTTLNTFIEDARPLIVALPTCWVPTTAGSMVAVGDVENDGLDELVVAQRGCSGVFHYLEGSPARLSFSRITYDGDTFGASVAAAGDINGDGLRDVLFGNPERIPASNALVMLGDSSAWRPATTTPTVITLTPPSIPRTLNFGDSVAWLRGRGARGLTGT